MTSPVYRNQAAARKFTGTTEELPGILDGLVTEEDYEPAANSDVVLDLVAWRDAAVDAERQRLTTIGEVDR